MYPKTLIAILLTFLCFFSCKKSDSNAAYPNKIVLNPLKVSGNAVTITWSTLNSDSFSQYVLMRVTDTSNSATAAYRWAIPIDRKTTKYVDTLPDAPYVQYYIEAENLTSNKETFVRTDFDFISIKPSDGIYDKDSHFIYVYSASGDIAIYDAINKKTVNQVATHINIGYCALGTYNGKKEFYMPGSDSCLYIYDAYTLTQIDKINIGTAVADVVYNNNVLYISTGVFGATVNAIGQIISYSRSDKNIISQTSYTDVLRIKLVPSSSTDLFAIDFAFFFYYDFNSSGTFNSQNTLYASPLQTTSTSMLEVYPDGSNFISGNTNDMYVFNRNLTYVATLPHLGFGISYTAFSFDMTNQLIYAGCSDNTIKVYSMNNYQLIKTIQTKNYPYKLFYDNGILYSVNTDPVTSYLGYPLSGYTFIEQFNP